MDFRGKHVVVANWRDLEHSMAGGAERYAWEVARALVEAGARVSFLTAREPGQCRAQEQEGIRVIRRGGRLSFYLRAALFLLLHRRSIDLVVDAESGIPVFAPLFVRRSTPVVLVVHHVHLDQFGIYFPPLVARLGRFLEGVVMPRAYRRSQVVAVSPSTRDDLRRRLGWTTPIGLLLNGNSAPASDAVAAVDPADTVDRLVALGRLAPHKRVDVVVRAVAALSTVRPAIHLDVIGSGPDGARLADLVDRLDVAKHVTLHGHLDETAKSALLARARLHVTASDVEGWGQVVIEAAAHGVPTLARDVPGLRDSVRDETTGWLVAEPDHDLVSVQARLVVALDAALNELEDGERRDEIAAACRSWAAGFSWAAMHDEARALVARSWQMHAQEDQ